MKKSVLLFALCMYIFAGCNKEPQNTTDQEECQVAVSFSNDFTKSLLKSTASAQEKTISRVILFGLDASEAYVGKYYIDHSPAATEPVTISKKVKKLYAIANYTSAIDALVSPNKATLDALYSAITTATNPATTPFLMGGSGDVNVSGSNYSVDIALIRTVAKVQFSSSTAGLVISSVTVKNTPRNAYVFKQSSVAVPTPADRGDYTAVAGAAPIVYVAESVNPNGDATNTTTFQIIGTFDGGPVDYTLTLKSGTNNLSIERNKHYTVSVSATSTTSCTVNITIPDWDDVNAGDQLIP